MKAPATKAGAMPRSDIECKIIEGALPSQVQPAVCRKLSDHRFEVKFRCSCSTEQIRIKKTPLKYGDNCEMIINAVAAHFETDAHRGACADKVPAQWLQADIKALINKQQRLRDELRGLEERGTKRSREEAAPTLPPTLPPWLTPPQDGTSKLVSVEDVNELASRRRLETIARGKGQQELDPSNRDPWPQSSTSKSSAVDDGLALLRQHCKGSMEKAEAVILGMIRKLKLGWP
jgi:hypothetical protein